MVELVDAAFMMNISGPGADPWVWGLCNHWWLMIEGQLVTY